MRFDRILALGGLVAALSPLSLAAQATSGARCADGTKAESRYMACWFHGGVVVAPAAAQKSRPAAPTRSASLRESSTPSASRKPHAAEASRKASKKPARNSSKKSTRAAKRPKGATALCNDGSYTDDRKPKRGCKKHDGVAHVLPQKNAKH